MRLKCLACLFEFESQEGPAQATCPRCQGNQFGVLPGPWGGPPPGPPQGYPRPPVAPPPGYPGGAPPGYAPPAAGPQQGYPAASPPGYAPPGYAPPGYGGVPQAYGGGPGYAMPPPLNVQTYQVVSVVVLAFCCQPAGIMSLLWIEEAKKKHNLGQFDEAQKKLGQAKMMLIIGPIVGAVVGVLYVVLSVLGS